MDTNLLTTRQLASLLNISVKQVWSLLDQDVFPFSRYHSRAIVKAEDLICYLAGRLSDVDSILPHHTDMGGTE